jgi:hypothetical protein
MKYFYRLEHIHNNYGYEQKLYIGTFSSIENIEVAIEALMPQQGFKKFPRKAFKITKVEVDKLKYLG